LKTYETLYENEVRPISISIRDEDDNIWAPDSATAKVVNSDGIVVVDEAAATVLSNIVTTIITTVVTSIPGTYEVIWKMGKTLGATYIYYHKTLLSVEEL